MTRPVRLSSLAALDLQQARDWFDQREAGLGDKFLESVEQTLDRISTNAEQYQIALLDLHRARIAIDATLIGAHLISDRKAHVAYTNRTKPFDNFARYLSNLIKDGKPVPHPLVPELVRLHKRLSTFTSHADIGSFVHRITMSQEEGVHQIRVQYFQYSKTPAERQIHTLTLFHVFVMVLDVFSEFLALEHKIVPKEWQFEMIRIGIELEREVKRLKATLPPEMLQDPQTGS